MPRDLARLPPKSRYDYQSATRQIARELANRGRGNQKVVAAAVNLTEAQFSHRMRGTMARFTIEHIGAIADFWDMPPGWPFVTDRKSK